LASVNVEDTDFSAMWLTVVTKRHLGGKGMKRRVEINAQKLSGAQEYRKDHFDGDTEVVTLRRLWLLPALSVDP
jgi:hypothetical protein